jgi:pimeloyl-ACP methyl ester carboxylesterase
VSARAETLAHLRLASEIAGMRIDELALPADQHAVVDGLRLHYLDWGTRGRPPLLFLHGGHLTAHTRDLVALALRRDFHCLALDQRGHGDSDWSPDLDYSPETNARDIGAWIEHLGVDRPVLIGQSLGGLHAMTYAALPDRPPAGIALIDVGPGIESGGAQRIVDFALHDPGPGSLEDFVARAVAFNRRRDPRLLRRSLLHNLRQLPDGNWTWKHDPRRATSEFFASTKSSVERLRDRVDTISCPVLVVRGAESDVYGDDQAAAFAQALPDGRWAKVQSAGHNVQGDNPAGLVQVLSDFLAEIGVGPGRRARGR